jgi:conjugative transfer signal peptidase TraF
MSRPRPVALLVTAALAVSALAWAQVRTGDLVVYNHSRSIPVGLYVRIGVSPTGASIVTVRARDVALDEAVARGFDGQNDRFIKRVAALAGDIVCADGDVILINGRHAAERRRKNSTGSILPRWEGCIALSADELFLLGDTPDSFDSRYWGPVRRSLIEGVWKKL